MAILNLNLNDPLMKALKAVNSIGGKSLTEEDLKRQRSSMELAGKLAAPSDDVTIKRCTIGEGKAALPCEWVKPDLAHNPNYIILYAHGGGYTCGGLSYARILAAKGAISTGFSVISFEYRLAPEHTYPAQLNDCESVWKYLKKMGYKEKQILLAGDSAGGNLVLCFTQKLLSNKKRPPRMLLLFSPWTDMTATSKSYEKYEGKDPILNKEFILGVRDAYVGVTGKTGEMDESTTTATGKENPDYADPRFSPLFGDFENFPTTYIQVGKNEVLHDDSTSLYKKMKKAGVPAEIDVEQDGWHVYQQMPLPVAGRAMKRLASYVSEEIYGEKTMRTE